jgi:hypothetical protein
MDGPLVAVGRMDHLMDRRDAEMVVMGRNPVPMTDRLLVRKVLAPQAWVQTA